MHIHNTPIGMGKHLQHMCHWFYSALFIPSANEAETCGIECLKNDSKSIFLPSFMGWLLSTVGHFPSYEVRFYNDKEVLVWRMLG